MHLDRSCQAQAAVLAKAHRAVRIDQNSAAAAHIDRQENLRPTASAALGRDPHQARVVNPSGPAEVGMHIAAVHQQRPGIGQHAVHGQRPIIHDAH